MGDVGSMTSSDNMHPIPTQIVNCGEWPILEINLMLYLKIIRFGLITEIG